jgi:homoserine kinase type II
MAVFTEVSLDEARRFVESLGIGTLSALRGVPGGIENTNYFVDTDRGAWVLTLFERLRADELPFYLHLMRHLARKGLPVPEPRADASGAIVHTLAGRPAALVDRIAGHHQLAPGADHCAQVGEILARLHLAASDYERQQPNPRGLAWWQCALPEVLPHVDADRAALLTAELGFQQALAASPAHAALPRGAIHADLFRDNVVFDGPPGRERLCGLFDFYFAGVDVLAFDIAVCLNDWCIDLDSGRGDDERAAVLLAAYERLRPLTGGERRLLPALLRAAALRFWLSRLHDLHLPRDARLLAAHDPEHFERVLRGRIESPWHPPPAA